MNLKQLEYFITVAECLNFTQAAKKCFVSQAAMTQQIKSLETRLGVKLFERNKHQVTLTSAGHSYLNDARNILSQVDIANKRAKTAAEGLSGHLKIGFNAGFEYEDISESLRNFHTAYPNIHLEFVRHNMTNLYAMLEDFQCDVIFNLSPYKQSYPHLKSQHLKTYPMMAVLYPGHFLAGRSSLTYGDLKNEDFIIMQPKDRSNDEAEEVMICYERGGFLPNIIHREREVQTLLLMVSVGLGVAILPEYCVRFFHHAKNLTSIPLLSKNGEAETIDFVMAWNQANTNPVIEKIEDFYFKSR